MVKRRSTKKSILAAATALTFLLSMQAHISYAATPPPPATGPKSTPIMQGGNWTVLQTGQGLTSGQAAAVNQVLTQGRQSLLLNGQGTAVGGTVNLMGEPDNEPRWIRSR
jgi:hypothetical protein